MKLIKEEIDLRVNTPYMLRNDGKVIKVKYERPSFFVDHPYVIRDRNLDMKAAVRVAVLDRLQDIDWFYQNTNKERTRVEISRFFKILLDNTKYFFEKDELSESFIKELADKFAPYDTTYVVSIGEPRDVYEALLHINDAVNQEFLRFRTGAGVYNTSKVGVYFRVSSKGFDWSDLIAKVIKSHYYEIDNISISKDPNTLDSYDNYKINGENISCTPLEEIDLKNLPFIESLFCLRDNLPFSNYLKEGKTLLECFWCASPRHLTEEIIKKDKVK